MTKIRVKNLFFGILLINSVSLNVVLLVEIHLFNTEKVRIMQSKCRVKKMLKINENRQFYWLSIRF